MSIGPNLGGETTGSVSFIDERPFSGYLHSPRQSKGDGLVLTHGAGANCQSPLLVALAGEFVDNGFTVLRFDLPFRKARPHGPPMPGGAARDREGIKAALEFVRSKNSGQVFAGGHSYGGRQTTMLLAEKPELADGLLLLSYPLHPPKRPDQLRTAHFPTLRTPALFVHGMRDAFGSIDEMTEALNLIPARTELLPVEGAGHELLSKKNEQALLKEVMEAFTGLFGLHP